MLAHGPALLDRVGELCTKHVTIKAPFEACLKAVRREQESAGIEPLDCTPLLDIIQRLYLRLRGRDFVKTLLSALKLKQAAASANTLRGVLAAEAPKNGSSPKMKRPLPREDEDAGDLRAGAESASGTDEDPAECEKQELTLVDAGLSLEDITSLLDEDIELLDAESTAIDDDCFVDEDDATASAASIGGFEVSTPLLNSDI